jgi:hypothetical protein
MGTVQPAGGGGGTTLPVKLSSYHQRINIYLDLFYLIFLMN